MINLKTLPLFGDSLLWANSMTQNRLTNSSITRWYEPTSNGVLPTI